MDTTVIMPDTTIRLPHKPDAPLSYQFRPGKGWLSSTHLIVFLNGLILLQDDWRPTIRSLQNRWAKRNVHNHPAILTYDRYGQGASARDPSDASNDGTHTITEVVSDLHELILEVWRTRVIWEQRRRPGWREPKSEPNLILVGNSIGCVIARLYTSKYPGIVEALLFLDSNIANSDQVSLFPDPDSPSFDPRVLPFGTTVDELRRVREGYRSLFHPSVANPEHLDRSSIADLLPESWKPKLVGAGEPGEEVRGPLITVVGHDWNTFADEGLHGKLHVPKNMTNRFVNPAWNRYNEGLVHLTDQLRARGPITAVGCGHFIQRDDPALVAQLIQDTLAKMGWA
ncbi:alpha/beta-hydrolase [Annulohypoxylon maeteangense]|uniref:alpha/beta-hydrolase n=1 Tax=Annulohypoxylon maeteangense TaxID=1927788 RepID=UPI0020080293|nr:alpha/beta-hydrolase [Annulohypoxylon maeteangense]KAI0890217.1 alpha/beta-hydrolase [Annulohypoxylon maeteangense]